MRARAPLVKTFQNEEDAVYRKRLRCGRDRERRRVAFLATRDDSRGEGCFVTPESMQELAVIVSFLRSRTYA
jgi:hypothetical protein